MKRYILFAWCKDLINEEDPRGGWNDYVGEGDTIEEIVEVSSYYGGLCSVFTDGNYCQIVDTMTLKKLEHQYEVKWSEEDNEWVATCSKYPSLSHLAKTQKDALVGIIELVIQEDTKNRYLVFGYLNGSNWGWDNFLFSSPTIEDIQDKVKKVNTGGDPKVAPFEYNDYFYPNIQVVDLETQETIRVKLKEKAYKEVN